jgi:protein-arginine kinase
LVLTQPAHLQRQAGAEMSPAERNVYRAQVVRERLAAADAGPGTDPRSP